MTGSGGASVMVSGGAGYIGSHAVKGLLGRGYNVLTYDSLAEGHRQAVLGGDFFQGELASREQLDQAMSTFRPKIVMHFAAHCYVGESVEDPGKYYRNNVSNTLNLLEACRDNGVEGVIFSSTAAVFGNPVSLPIEETHPQAPINPYGETKLIGERMLRDFETAYGLKHTVLRYFNAAGADPEGQLGEDHDPETHLLPLVLKTALGKRDSVQVFGTDYDTRDGSCLRDYVHVTDLAEAHIMALQRLLDGGASDSFNLGNSLGTSVLEVIQTAERITGKKIKHQLCDRRPGDPAVLVADSAKMEKSLGWKPKYQDIEAILTTAWDWMAAHPDGYNKR